MEKIIIRGGKKLNGTVKVEGAKNAVLPIIAASLLAEKGKSIIRDVPALSDVYTINEVLRHLNAKVHFSGDTVEIDASNPLHEEAPFEYVRKMRASVLVMGPLLARLNRARVALPGGCAIGQRPIDQHLKGFEAMGAVVKVGNGFIDAKVDGRLKGARIYLDIPSVGATENIMMAATLAEGTTIIENCAKEPEIVDLANYLNKMGAIIKGAGTETIRIEGVESLTGCEHTVIPDRIEAGTFITAAAMTGGNIFVQGAVPEHISSLIAKLEEMGVRFEEEKGGVRVIAPEILQAVDIKTMPYPGFPTDLQPQIMAVLLRARGTSMVTETVFENRFMHVEEFRRMNADLKIEGRSVIINGPYDLQGAEVMATDLRAGAALVIAGLGAKGITRVAGLHHIDRGYVAFHEKLRALGADIERIDTSLEEMPGSGREEVEAIDPIAANLN